MFSEGTMLMAGVLMAGLGVQTYRLHEQAQRLDMANQRVGAQQQTIADIQAINNKQTAQLQRIQALREQQDKQAFVMAVQANKYREEQQNAFDELKRKYDDIAQKNSCVNADMPADVIRMLKQQSTSKGDH